ncbi:MAG: aspartate aminotransferase family protein [Theionarchaea archaeon]|nr:aspartate aminotransferase family protein [Theionarchaea archaeon]
MESSIPILKRSEYLHSRASCVMPGGDTRSVTFFPPLPPFFIRGSGSVIWDADGNEYSDFLNNYTSLILGHARPEIVEAVSDQIKKGSVFPSPSEEQIFLAELLIHRLPSCEKIRFCNSGTEANIQAFRAAKTVTGKKKILKISGGYHGSFDFEDFVEIPFNDLENAENVIKKYKNKLACVIVEPVLGKGMIPASREFLEGLRELTHTYDIIYILDEVVTFRLAEGGAQSLYDISPDLTVLGKIIGGGFPVGAFGGREDIMEHFSPLRKEAIYHSGTFNGNPVTMVGGLETLKIFDAFAIEALNSMGERLKKTLNDMMEDQAACVEGMGSLLHFHFTRIPAQNAQDLENQPKVLFSRLHEGLMKKGIFMAPRGMFNLSVAHSSEDMKKFERITEQVISQVLRV